MRWLYFTMICMFSISMSSLKAEEASADFFAEEDAFLGLESEIEGLLEEDNFDSEVAEDPLFQQLEEEKTTLLPIQNQVQNFQVKEIAQEPISLAVEVDQILAEEEKMIVNGPANLEAIKEETFNSVKGIEINLRQVFAGSPIIYILLFGLSSVSLCIWLYSIMTVRSIEFLPPTMIKELRTKLISNQFDEALDLCVKEKHFFCKMLASGILSRKYGLNVMIDNMKAEGKRSTIGFWQRIGILNEIAVIAPMLGLLGTVMGMFYAFYDLNRSVESVSLLFDGLGISVGTTVAGLIVAILAMILHSLAKYRLVRILANVENEAQIFAALIDTRGSAHDN